MNTIGCIPEKSFYRKDLWHSVAVDFGYETANDMLYIMYFEEMLPLSKMEEFLGWSRSAIAAKVQYFGLVQGRGGPNNPTGIKSKKEAI